jgi:hypothetical protein
MRNLIELWKNSKLAAGNAVVEIWFSQLSDNRLPYSSTYVCAHQPRHFSCGYQNSAIPLSLTALACPVAPPLFYYCQ